MAHFESAKNGFGFDYPADWKLSQSVTAQANVGNSALEDVVMATSDGAKVLVSVYQLNTVLTEANMSDARADLDQVMANLAQQLGGKVTYGQPFKIGSINGFEYNIQYSKDGKTLESRQRNFFVDDRQYVVTIETDADGQTRHGRAVEQLLSSFEARLFLAH